jgi:hypothetical protein
VKNDQPAELKPNENALRKRLMAVRNALLNLHKTLVDSERASYETTFGKIPSANHFLQLLTHDPWFAWLHPLSQLIVSMDQALDEKEPLTAASVEALVKESGVLLAASEVGEGFSRHYYEALQSDPGVVLAHADASRLVSTKKPKG